MRGNDGGLGLAAETKPHDVVLPDGELGIAQHPLAQRLPKMEGQVAPFVVDVGNDRTHTIDHATCQRVSVR